jgi:hypothetical protein
MTDEDAPIEDWISSRAAVDDAIIQPALPWDGYGRPGGGRGGGGSEEHADAAPWEEGIGEVSAKVVFAFITLASMITVIIDPKMIAVTLPLSVLAALLLSMARGRRGRRAARRRGGLIRPGEEPW